MARTTITPVALPDTGYNLTDSAAFTAMTPGANNGVEVSLDNASRIILKNTTGGAARHHAVGHDDHRRRQQDLGVPAARRSETG